MTSRRPLVLMAVLLVLVLGYVSRPYLPFLSGQPSAPAYVVTPPEPPLPGENSISNLVVHQNDSGVWQVSFDYYYTGSPQYLGFGVHMPMDGNEPRPRVRVGLSGAPFAKRGSHSVSRRGSTRASCSIRTAAKC